MNYSNATCGQRFITYLIDFIIIEMVAGLIASAIPAYSQNMNIFQEDMGILVNQIYNGSLDMLLYQEMMRAYFAYTGILLLISLVVTFLYLVVLPYYWPKQTVGRLAMGLKVINLHNNEPVSFGKLALRELVGSFLLYRILSSTLIIALLNWYYCASRGRSFADMIGGTRLVYVRGVVEEENYYSENSSNHDYVNAEFHEVKQEPKEESKDNSSDNDYKVF